ncbi:UNVERIFIED_CONTAM: NDP-sugar pyrophosphorylase family protein [Streptomyces canus]
MKVVLFCGGYGMRMRNGTSDDVPKPMAMVGPRPLIWHVMRYYAHFGHTEFILCLGYGAHHIKNFFLNYEETTSNDFVLRKGGDRAAVHRHLGLDDHVRADRHRVADRGAAAPGAAPSGRRRDVPRQLR